MMESDDQNSQEPNPQQEINNKSNSNPIDFQTNIQAKASEDLLSQQQQLLNQSYYTIPDMCLYCHRIRLKGSNINISTIKYFKCFKFKEKKNFFSTIGLKSSKMIQKNYFMFFEEKYMYLMKDVIADKQHPNIRRLGNRYELLLLANIDFLKDKDEKYKDNVTIVMEFYEHSETDNLYEKRYECNEKEAQEFYTWFSRYMVELGVWNVQQEEHTQQQQEMQNEGQGNGQGQGQGQGEEKKQEERNNEENNIEEEIVNKIELKNDIRLDEKKQEQVKDNKIEPKKEDIIKESETKETKGEDEIITATVTIDNDIQIIKNEDNSTKAEDESKEKEKDKEKEEEEEEEEDEQNEEDEQDEEEEEAAEENTKKEDPKTDS